MKRMHGAFILILVFCCLDSVEARIIRVPMQFNTIQNAIDNSDNGDTVLVGRNRYRERVNFNGLSISVLSDFVITGDQEDIEQTIIDGSANEGSVVVIRNCQQAVLSGFTITGGFTDYGGGVYCRESNVTFSHLIVEGNETERNGAGIYCTRQGEILIHDVIIRNNTAGYVGGGFSCYGGANVTMRNVTMYDNECDHVGGALHCFRAELTLENVTLVNNYALHSGGALYVTQAGRVHINNSILWENSPHEIYLMSGNDTTNVEIFFSDIEGGVGEIVDFEGGHMDWGVGNINSDPSFEDEDESDFNLSEDSPCIDAGHMEYDPDPDTTRRDIGAYYTDQEEGGSHVLHVPDVFDTIQEAIDEASDGDIVLVQPGEYFENVRLESNITLGSRLISTGDEEFIESTILDGSGDGTVISIGGDIPDAQISGFTVQNGVGRFGGGILCGQTNATLSNLLVQDNRAEANGGGIAIISNENIGPIIRRMTIINNEAGDSGGGVSINDEDNNDAIIIEDVNILENQATLGGGIFMLNSSPNVRRVNVSNNSSRFGGGIYMGFSNPDINRVIISNNSSEISGSAFSLWQSNPRLNNVTIASNTSEDNREVISLGVNCHLVIANSIIWGNEPSDIVFTHENSTITVVYSDIENGEDAITGDGEINWGEGNIDQDPQFVDGDNGDFYLTENSPCIDAGMQDRPIDPDGSPADIGAYYFDHGGEVVDFTINLAARWNVIFSPVQPPNLSMESVFSELIENGNLLTVKSETGRFFRPDHEFNNINGWDVRYGYWVKVGEAENIIISNRFVQEDIPIPLDDGWSIVSYFPQQQIEVTVATVGILDELEIIKDSDGRFYLPEYEFSNMDLLRRGQGYQLKVGAEIELVWNTEGEELNGIYSASNLINLGEPSHFTAFVTSHYNMSLLITETTLFKGIVELGAFDSEGMCIGATRLNPNGKTGIALWGDDPATDLSEGLQADNQPIYKVWKDGVEMPAEIEWILGDGSYQSDGYVVGNLSFDSSVPTEFILDAPYPNPFNSQVRLSFDLPNAGLTILSVYDISGRLVSQTDQFYPEAGRF